MKIKIDYINWSARNENLRYLLILVIKLVGKIIGVTMFYLLLPLGLRLEIEFIIMYCKIPDIYNCNISNEISYNEIVTQMDRCINELVYVINLCKVQSSQ